MDNDNGHGETLDVRGDQFAIVPIWLYDAEVPLRGEARAFHRLSRDAVALFGLLAGRYANREGKAFPTHTQLARDLAASDRSVRRWLDELEAVGALTRVVGRPGRASVYTLRISRTVKTRGDSRGGPRTLVSGGSDTGVRAARTPVSDQPEDLINQRGAAAPRGGGASGAGAVNPTRDVSEIRARDERSRAEAADPEVARRIIAEAKARAQARGKSPDPPEVPE